MIDAKTNLGALTGESATFGDAADYQPGRAELGFTITSGTEAVWVKALIATLRVVERGTVQVSAQAIMRQAPAAQCLQAAAALCLQSRACRAALPFSAPRARSASRRWTSSRGRQAATCKSSP